MLMHSSFPPCSIMSAIDMFATLDVIEGKQGEKRVCISLNGCVSQTLWFHVVAPKSARTMMPGFSLRSQSGVPY